MSILHEGVDVKMSKLYLTADTDMVKTSRTARGNRRIDARIGYNPGDYSKKIRTTLIREDDKLELTIFDKDKTLLVCEGTVQDGITQCQPYSHAGPYPWIATKYQG